MNTDIKLTKCYFIPDKKTSSATICANCGKEKYLHIIGEGFKAIKVNMNTIPMPHTDKQPQTVYVKCEKCDNGIYIDIIPGCCNKPTEDGRCCGNSIPVQVQEQCSTCRATGLIEIPNVLLHTPEELEVKIEVADNYFPVQCQTCGWFGSSAELHGGHAIADTGDHSDCYCPVCGQVDPDECEEKLPILAYKNAYEKMSILLIESKRLYEEQLCKNLSDNINKTEELQALKAEWQREQWISVEKYNYSMNAVLVLVDNKAYPIVIAEKVGNDWYILTTRKRVAITDKILAFMPLPQPPKP